MKSTVKWTLDLNLEEHLANGLYLLRLIDGDAVATEPFVLKR